MIGIACKITLYSIAFILTSLLLAVLLVNTTRYYVSQTPKREDGWPLRFCSRTHPCNQRSDTETIDNFYYNEQGYYVRGNECHRLMDPPTYF